MEEDFITIQMDLTGRVDEVKETTKQTGVKLEQASEKHASGANIFNLSGSGASIISFLVMLTSNFHITVMVTVCVGAGVVLTITAKKAVEMIQKNKLTRFE